jgi:hypothetical protein
MQMIDVSDLPESVAQAIEGLVQTLRQHLPYQGQQQRPIELPRWDGEVLGELTREEIYGDGALG